jgi:hypothetical protein
MATAKHARPHRNRSESKILASDSGTNAALHGFDPMIAILITPATYGAIKARLFVPQAPPPPDANGLILLWLDHKFVDELDRRLRPGDSYSDVILRLVETCARLGTNALALGELA